MQKDASLIRKSQVVHEHNGENKQKLNGKEQLKNMYMQNLY